MTGVTGKTRLRPFGRTTDPHFTSAAGKRPTCRAWLLTFSGDKYLFVGIDSARIMGYFCCRKNRNTDDETFGTTNGTEGCDCPRGGTRRLPQATDGDGLRQGCGGALGAGFANERPRKVYYYGL